MAFNTQLADRVREYLAAIPGIDIEEKRMFSGMAFMVNGKMCVNIAGERLMCRFDPEIQDKVENRQGFETMVMRGRELVGYCYVNEDGFRTRKDFEYWISICLDFNSQAKASPASKTAAKKKSATRSSATTIKKSSTKPKSATKPKAAANHQPATKSRVAIKAKSTTKSSPVIKSKPSSTSKPGSKNVAGKAKPKK